MNLDYDAAGTTLTTCDDGSYCCGFDNTKCCDQGGGTKIDKNGRILAKGQITSSVAAPTSTATPSSTGSSRSSSSTNSAQTAAPATTTNQTLPSPNSQPSSGLSGGAKAGIAIGCVAAVALIAGLLFLLFRERRKSRALRDSNEKPQYENLQSVPNHEGQPPQEMTAHDQGRYHLRGEMDGQSRPQELHS